MLVLVTGVKTGLRRAGMRPSTGRRGTGSSDITITGDMRNAEC